MLRTKLIDDKNRELAQYVVTIDGNAARIDAFDAWLHSIGGTQDGVGKFVESIVAYNHIGRVGLRLQLCAADIHGDEWMIEQIADLERRIGQELSFTNHHTWSEATINHPTVGEIFITISDATAEQIAVARELHVIDHLRGLHAVESEGGAA